MSIVEESPTDWLNYTVSIEIPYACAKWMAQCWSDNNIGMTLEQGLLDNYPGKIGNIILMADGTWHDPHAPTDLIKISVQAIATRDLQPEILRDLNRLVYVLVHHPDLAPIASRYDNRQGLREAESRVTKANCYYTTAPLPTNAKNTLDSLLDSST